MPETPPKSKQASGAAGANIGNAVLHSAPVQSGSIKPPRQVNPEPRFYNENLTAINKFVDSNDFEGSANIASIAKTFEFNQGFKGSEPIILFSSNFSPLYKDSSKNDTGNALQLKNDAKILNMKTALDVFMQTKGFKDELVANQKKSLLDFIKTQSTALYEISNSNLETISSLDLSSYKEKVTKENGLQQEVGFIDFLKSVGYANIDQFSNTKLWQQSLVELKKSLLTHSLTLLGVPPTKIEDKEQWTLYGIESEDATTKRTRIWFNPYISLPRIKDFFILPSDQNLVTQKLQSFKELLASLENSQYFDLSINADPAIKTSPDPSDKNATQLSSGNLSSLSKILSSKVLEKYVDSGRDISIIANMIFKELIYSSILSNPYSNFTSNLPQYGYSVSTSGDNFRVWDHVVGRFSKDIRNIVKSPTGNGNSLVSFSQKVEEEYQVLTFEKSNIVESQKNFTPGNLFYVESSLNTVGLTQNDFSRLDNLIKSTKNSIDTLDRIYEFLGYVNVEGNYTKFYTKDYSLSNLVKQLSLVSKVYKSCLALEPALTVGGKTFYSAKGLDSSKLKKLSEVDSVGVRFAAVICKTAVSAQKQSFYGMVSQDIKSLLFMWLMNAVIFKVERTPTAGVTAGILQGLISQKLNISVGSSFDISKATDEGRTYPFKVGTDLTETKREVAGVEVDFQPVVNDAFNSFYKNSISSRIFQISTDKGLWKIMVDVLTDIYRKSIFTTGNETSGPGFTQYSGVSKTAYMYSYFDLMLRIIAAQTPEDLMGVYDNVYDFSSAELLQFLGVAGLKQGGQINSLKINESGFLLAPVSDKILQEYFNSDALNNDSAYYYSTKLKNAINVAQSEDDYNFSSMKMFMNYLKTLNYKLSKFRETVDKNLKNYSNNVASFFDETSLQGLNEAQRSALFNLTMSQEQTIMNRYIMDEYIDRFENSADAESKLKKNPEFSKFAKGFSDLMSVNDIEIISHDLLSSYFRSTEFQQVKSNNKKIISVGFPPKLFRSLKATSNPNADVVGKVLENIVRVRLYKIDRLRPTIVYKSQEYLFEMNRFVTRVVSNWDTDAIVSDDANLLRIPTKLFDAGRNVFRVCRDFSQAFPPELYGVSGGGPLDESTKLSIYTNHVKSFLAEEYLRWLTDLKLDETRYHRYTSLTEDVSLISNQYNTYLNYLGANLSTQRSAITQTATLTPSVLATFTDPLSKNTYTIPVDTTAISNSESFLTSKQSSGQSTNMTNKKFNLNLDSTMKSYFQNETILSDNNSELKKRASLPKKFDRTFSIIFDPDDFIVDSYSEKSDLDEAIKVGIIVNDNGVYRHRDTSPQDVTFDEYFITVEPYDYVLPSQPS